MAAATIEINGLSFAIGLTWQPLSNARPRTELPGLMGSGKETRRVAKEFDCDLVSWSVEDEDIQHGFTSSSTTTGKPLALAPVVTRIIRNSQTEHVRNFLLALPYSHDQLYYLAVQDGIILPESDLLLSEDEAQVHVLNEMTAGGWDLVYTPAHWGIQDAKTASIEELLFSGSKLHIKPPRYMYVAPVARNPVVALAPLVLVAGAVGLSWYGYNYYQDYQLQERIEAQRQAALANQQAETPPPPPPWVTTPRAGLQWQACLKGANEIPLWPGYWSLANISCAGSSVNASWRRDDLGWVTHIQEAIPGIAVSPDGETAQLSVAIESIPAAGEGEELPVRADRILGMKKIAQHLGVPISISVESRPPQLPGQAGYMPAPAFETLRWSIQGPEQLLSSILHTMDSDGFRIDTATATLSDTGLIWSLEGKQYVK